MRILVACEKSDTVASAFRARGHEVYSCDVEPTDGNPAYHIQGDVRPFLREPWNLIVAHPPCTHLTTLTWCWGNHYRIADWWDRHYEAVAFFHACLNANAPLIAVENPPQMNPPAKAAIGKPDDRTDFMYFGAPYRKRVGWWLKGLPPLMHTVISPPNVPSVVRFKRSVAARAAHSYPSDDGLYPDRHFGRSRFSPEMAAAMAEQWG